MADRCAGNGAQAPLSFDVFTYRYGPQAEEPTPFHSSGWPSTEVTILSFARGQARKTPTTKVRGRTELDP